MPDKFSKTLSKFLLIICIALVSFIVITEKKDFISINGDAKGYYAYLPAVFINHSLNWELIDESIPGYSKDFISTHNEKTLNKYSPGTALLIFPFFILALFVSSITGFATDGFSLLFQYSILIASVTYMTIGLRYIAFFLKSFGIQVNNIFLSLAFILFGTNLLYYAIYEPGMPHVYASFTISGFAYYAKQYFTQENKKNLIMMVLCLALSVLIRPTHLLLILLLPFLAGSLSNLKNALPFRNVAISLSIFLPIMFLLPLLWYLQTKSFFVMPYKNEGFYFLEPEILNVLFSFKKGLFIYTPILLISLSGLIHLYSINKKLFMLLGSFTLFVIYFLSSWWNWYYGDSFAQRAFIDYFIIFALPLGLLFEKSNKPIRILSISICFVLTSLCVAQTFQYKTGIIHPDAMNAERYQFSFLKMGDEYKNSFRGAPESFYTPHGKEKIKEYYIRADATENILDRKSRINKHKVIILKEEYSPALTISAGELSSSNKRIYLQASTEYYKFFSEYSDELFFVTNISDSNGNSYYYKSEKLISIEQNAEKQWHQASFGFRLPEVKSDSDKISCYIWNKAKKEIAINDLKIEFWGAN